MKTMLNVTLSAAFGASLLALSPVAPAAAAEIAPPTTVKKCKRGEIRDRRTKKCVKKKKRSSNLHPQDIYVAARLSAYDGAYAEALDILSVAGKTDNPQILNYRGYVTRKMGDVEGALKHYRAALASDPDYTLARAYMGEAYLLLGDKAAAQEQLAEIASRCGTHCSEYTTLSEKLALLAD